MFGGLGFDSQWLSIHFSVSILIYHQLLLIGIVTKIIMYLLMFSMIAQCRNESSSFMV